MEMRQRKIVTYPDSELSRGIREALAAGRVIDVDTRDAVYELAIRRATPAGEASGTDPEKQPARTLPTPDQFFAEAIAPEDVREILRRLAK